MLLTAPTLTGAGLIGAALEVVPGTWGGQPAPAIALQWLRGGVEIAGETGARYLPQPADDGQEITCRVTAANASGALSAEPAPVRVVRAAPVVVDILADISVEQGADPVSVAAAAAFAGDGLGFAVTGAGATIDPVTGVLGLPTDVVRDGETVTVTATNSGGAAEASFLVSVTLPVVVIEAPALLAAPTLEGAARIGATLTVATGLWSGLPLLSLQWLRDGAEIGGATAATYVPVPADDRCGFELPGDRGQQRRQRRRRDRGAHRHLCRADGGGRALRGDPRPGHRPADRRRSSGLRRREPRLRGDRGRRQHRCGDGVLSTDIALSDEVTVTATNSGGQASASFRVTVEAPEFPGLLEDRFWSVSEVRGTAPEGRRQVTIAPGVVPAGYELGLYSGPADGRSNTDWRRVMQPGETYITTAA